MQTCMTSSVVRAQKINTGKAEHSSIATSGLAYLSANLRTCFLISFSLTHQRIRLYVAKKRVSFYPLLQGLESKSVS